MRQIWELNVDGTMIELALDQGQIIVDDYKESISEIELELKSGEKEVLLKFAEQLKRDINSIPGNLSKAARGYCRCEE